MDEKDVWNHKTEIQCSKIWFDRSLNKWWNLKTGIKVIFLSNLYTPAYQKVCDNILDACGEKKITGSLLKN